MFQDQVVLITGAGQGIGLALARAFAEQGARLALTDLTVPDIATRLGAFGAAADLRDPAQIEALVHNVETTLGSIDALVSNAGFAKGAMSGATFAPDAQWQDSWDLHVMAHLRAARLVLPGMIARGRGTLVNIASAAGLLSQIGDAPYSASKHAAVSLAQSLAIEHKDQGIDVSVVCPLYVATPLLGYDAAGNQTRAHDRVLLPHEVAEAVMAGLQARQFMILPHQEAARFFQNRAQDPERWVKSMQRLKQKIYAQGVPRGLDELHRRV